MFESKAVWLMTCATLALAPIASAEPQSEQPGDYSYSWHEPGMLTDIGVGIGVGGGVSGFTDATLRDTTSSKVDGVWDARATIGTHIPLGLDVGYVGEAAHVQTLQGVANGTLVGTTLEAALRYNILPHFAVNPYVFAGIGWQNYEVTSMRIATSDSGMKSSDNLAEFPMGLGLSLRTESGWTLDVRGTFRAEPSSTLVRDQTGTYASLHSWAATGAIGYEF